VPLDKPARAGAAHSYSRSSNLVFYQSGSERSRQCLSRGSYKASTAVIAFPWDDKFSIEPF
jgi:hypothetical protein